MLLFYPLSLVPAILFLIKPFEFEKIVYGNKSYINIIENYAVII